jgi:hypothetical protein
VSRQQAAIAAGATLRAWILPGEDIGVAEITQNSFGGFIFSFRNGDVRFFPVLGVAGDDNE